ncbi:hypothetical protein V7S43_002098 [Phytophthora oleae]|uniref:Uncharacterized protein n=1 Tax=Phytophthora oleae TaxID=2107226 RepID=A0ABD3G2V8_9STRA
MGAGQGGGVTSKPSTAADADAGRVAGADTFGSFGVDVAATIQLALDSDGFFAGPTTSATPSLAHASLAQRSHLSPALPASFSIRPAPMQ